MPTRGRPPKPKPPAFVVSTDASLERRQQLGETLQNYLQGLSVPILSALVDAAFNYELNRHIRHNAPLRRAKQGRRPEIAQQWLLADCASAYATELGKPAAEILAALGGWSEDSGDLDQHPVIRSAGAILMLLDGERGYRAWRRQVRGAIKRLAEN